MDWWRAKSRLFFWCLMSFVVGVALSYFFRIDGFVIFCMILASALGLIFCWANKRLVIAILLIFSFGLGFWRYQIALPNYADSNKIFYYNGQEVELQGVISAVDRRIDRQKLTVESRVLIIKKMNQGVSGKVLATVNLFPKYHYGDRVTMRCLLIKPDKMEDFDYGRYLSRYDIYSLCQRAEVRILSSGTNLSPREFIYSLVLLTGQKLGEALNRSVSEPEVAILQGMLFGNVRGISDDWNQKFSNLGITHIIAISGSHITIISSLIVTILIGLGISRKRAFWPAVALIIFYVVLSGAQVSAVRAAIMGVLILYAQRIGRLHFMENILAATVAMMLLVNPKMLLFDVGFQLSFAAVLGLVYVLPVAQKIFRNWPEGWQLKEMLLTTVSAQLATLPLLIFYFHKISWASLLANVLILPIIPFLMIWSLINSLVALISTTAGQVMGWISWLLVAYWLKVTDLLVLIPHGFINIEKFSWPVVIILYLLLIFLVRKLKNHYQV
ncbi:MAG: ComEC/Rec2 family competence protein [Patescibacteria group bacterium]